MSNDSVMICNTSLQTIREVCDKLENLTCTKYVSVRLLGHADTKLI